MEGFDLTVALEKGTRKTRQDSEAIAEQFGERKYSLDDDRKQEISS